MSGGPPPRPSGQTTVGLGVIEGARARELELVESKTTPPSGTERERFGGALREADVSLLLERIRATEEKQDATITDLRGLAADVRALLGSMRTRDEALFALLPLPEQTAALARRVVEVQQAVVALDRRVGMPPSTEDFARASHADTTPEELARLEQDHKLGTGLWRFVMSMHLRTSRSTRLAVGVGGGGGAVLGAVLSEVMRALF